MRGFRWYPAISLCFLAVQELLQGLTVASMCEYTAHKGPPHWSCTGVSGRRVLACIDFCDR